MKRSIEAEFPYTIFKQILKKQVTFPTLPPLCMMFGMICNCCGQIPISTRFDTRHSLKEFSTLNI